MAVKKLQPHHEAWLRAHPGRTEEWLREMFLEGFDIHHVDGDHSNNTPLNLVLIEAVDHMRLHGFKLPNGLTGWRKKAAINSRETRRVRKERLLAKQIKVDDEDEPPVAFIYQPVSGPDEMDVRAYLSRAGAF